MLAVVTTATLDYETGKSACKVAIETSGLLDIEYVVAHDKHRQGGVKTANTAWREALALDPQYLVYINDDVMCSQRDWLARMIAALEEHPRNGIAGPGGNCGTEPQRSSRPGLPIASVPVSCLSFFCVVIKRAVLDVVGLLDESYIHWGCDGDYGYRAQQHGWRLIWVQDVYVEHRYVPLAKRGPKLQSWRDHDLALFQQRWGYAASMPY